MVVLIVMGFLAGVATVLSPCILPILPIMLSGAVGGRARPYGILVGFVFSFALFTVFATFIVQSLGINIDMLRYVAAAILAILGLMLLFPQIQNKINSMVKMPSFGSGQKQGFGGGIATGATLGLVWAPCAGPILAAVITLAVSAQAGIASFLIVLSYALGTGLVMLVIILASRQALEKIKGLYKHLDKIHRAFGILVIIAALGIATGQDRKLQAYIVENIPDSYNELLQGFEESDVIKEALQELEENEIEARDLKFKNFKTNTDKTSIDFSDILSGGPGKDGIPALSNPKFTDISEAEFSDNVLGVFLELDGEQRYYPYGIMTWHEIVNDSIGDKNFAVTFCPLCGSAIVFDRNVDGKTLDFGVSGFLYESNLLMYDRQTESFWSQAGLEAVVGDYTGTKLQVMDMQLITFSKVKEKYPQAKILSTDTGHIRDYYRNPYSAYEDDTGLFFPVSVSDDRFPPKEVMYIIPYKDFSIALPQLELKEGQLETLELYDEVLEVRKVDDNIIAGVNGRVLSGYYEMWFSWATQHQDDGLVWEIKAE